MMNSNSFRFGAEAENVLSARRSASLRELAMHREDISKNYPTIEKLRKELAEIAVDMANKIIAFPEDSKALEKLALELNAAKQREIEIELNKFGLPADYLELKPRCAVCGDTGMADGQMCRCLKQHLINKAFSGSGLDPKQTFENFRHDVLSDPKDRRALDRIYNYCKELADRFPENEQNDLLLIGPPGVGKTFLLNCIGGRVLNRGYSVLRITAHRLVTSVLDSIRNGLPAPDLSVPDLLIIDDLGTEPMINNVTLETLLSVICERQDSAKATMIASNKDLPTLSEEYGDRILSRMVAPRVVKVIKMMTPSIRELKF